MNFRLTDVRLSERARKEKPIRMFFKSTLSTLLILFVALLLIGIFSQDAQAIGLSQRDMPEDFTIPRSFAYPWHDDDMYTSQNIGAANVKPLDIETAPIELIVDSDFGVDDTTAVGLLLAFPDQVHIQALVTVAGVTDVENAANNAQFILAQYGLTTEQIPVIVGAKKPWNVKLSGTSKLIHGPDGLWWLGELNPQPGPLPKTKAEEFYCKEAVFSQTTLLVLGPATNVAKALRQCPQKFEELTEIVVLGGAIAGGNTTPVAEFNFWQDPEAIQYLVDYAKPNNIGDPSRLKLTILPLDTFALVQYSLADILAMASADGSLGQLLTVVLPDRLPGPISYYAGAQAPDIYPIQDRPANLYARFLLPDAVAAAYVLRLAEASSEYEFEFEYATVEIVAGGGTPELIRGQSVMAFSQGDPPKGTTRQATMVYDNKTLSQAAEDSFTGVPFVIDPAPVNALLGPLEDDPPNNAKVLTGISEPDDVYSLVIDILKSPMDPGISAASPGEGNPSLDIFLPMIPK